MGTPDFAVPSLESLIKSKHNVQAVFTQPDKPKGRKMVLTPSDVKICAIENNTNVHQPLTFKNGEALDIIKSYNPDLIIVVAFGKLLPKEILDFPKYGCINVHGSLLPKYRGAAPIQRAVLDGDKKTGVTTMVMDVGLDTGDMLLQSETEILPDETSGELFDRLSIMGANLLLETLDKLEQGTLVSQKQDDSKSNYAKMINKSMCPIDFNNDAQTIHNQVRGLQPWPVATAMFENKKIKIHKTKLSDLSGESGKIISLSPLTVACGTGSIQILELQAEGKKRMDSKSFLLGNKMEIGQFLK